MPASVDKIRSSIIEPQVVLIRGGEFAMGCESGADNEKPVRKILVDDFGLARFAVTNLEYSRFVKDTAAESPQCFVDSRFNQPDQPVTSVSWFDAIAYCEWLSEQTGKRYRLPTEAEWERAARGGLERRLYSWGDEPPERQPDYFDLWRSGPETVGRRPPNGLGLYDISENIHEWCADWYDPDYYRIAPMRNPLGPDAGARRASRGGSWRHQIKIARVAARSSIPPTFRYADYGFRCALSR